MRKIPKVLVIGSVGHALVQCVHWADLLTLNIVDFDVIVADVSTLSPEILKSAAWDYFGKVRQQLVRALISKVHLIIIGDFYRYVTPKNELALTSESVNNYGWCPITLGIQQEAGNTIEVVSNEFRDYLAHLRTWDFFFFVPNACLTHELTNILGHPNNRTYLVKIESIVSNRYAKCLAGTIQPRVIGKDGSEVSLGKITLLPRIARLEQKERLNIILDGELGLPQTTLPPDWIRSISLPGQSDIGREIAVKLKTIETLESEIESLEARLKDREEYKKLLYASGVELEQIFSRCLRELGATVTPAKYSNEEFVVQFESRTYLVECKGVSKSIALTHVRQLFDYMTKYEEEEGVAGKGILLGNAWRDIAVGERAAAGGVFPDNVRKRASDLGVALLSSVTFYAEFCKYLDRQRAGRDVLNDILAAIGEVTFA